MSTNYFEIWNRMPIDQWVTAKEINIAPATMTAMIRRNLVEATNTSPKKYHRITNTSVIVEMLLFYFPSDTIGIYKKEQEIGMFCSVKNGKIYDCFDNPYDLSDAVKIRIGNRYFDLTNGKEIK